jgi:hypothetical protein
MRYNRRTLTTIAAPETLPVTVEEMAAFLVIEETQDDALIQSFIYAATDQMERYLRRALITQSLRLTMDGFTAENDEAIIRLGAGTHTASVPYLLGRTAEIDLPRGPVQSAVITTFNRVNSSSVFDAANWFLDTAGERVVLNEGRTWPDNLRDRAAVQIDYVAGYGAAADVPAAIRHGIKQMVAAMYECRQVCEMPAACKAMVEVYRRFDGLGWQ